MTDISKINKIKLCFEAEMSIQDAVQATDLLQQTVEYWYAKFKLARIKQKHSGESDTVIFADRMESEMFDFIEKIKETDDPKLIQRYEYKKQNFAAFCA